MGCFESRCVVSGLPIHQGEPVWVILLMKHNRYGSEHHVLYPTSMWVPFAFPFEGKYNDYGNVENIVEDMNTKLLHKFFSENMKTIFTPEDAGRQKQYEEWDKISREKYYGPTYSDFSNFMASSPKNLEEWMDAFRNARQDINMNGRALTWVFVKKEFFRHIQMAWIKNSTEYSGWKYFFVKQLNGEKPTFAKIKKIITLDIIKWMKYIESVIEVKTAHKYFTLGLPQEKRIEECFDKSAEIWFLLHDWGRTGDYDEEIKKIEQLGLKPIGRNIFGEFMSNNDNVNSLIARDIYYGRERTIVDNYKFGWDERFVDIVAQMIMFSQGMSSMYIPIVPMSCGQGTPLAGHTYLSQKIIDYIEAYKKDRWKD